MPTTNLVITFSEVNSACSATSVIIQQTCSGRQCLNNLSVNSDGTLSNNPLINVGVTYDLSAGCNGTNTVTFEKRNIFDSVDIIIESSCMLLTSCNVNAMGFQITNENNIAIDATFNNGQWNTTFPDGNTCALLDFLFNTTNPSDPTLNEPTCSSGTCASGTSISSVCSSINST